MISTLKDYDFSSLLCSSSIVLGRTLLKFFWSKCVGLHQIWRQEGKGWDPINWFSPVTSLCLSNVRTKMYIDISVCSSLCFNRGVVHIHYIVHHYLDLSHAEYSVLLISQYPTSNKNAIIGYHVLIGCFSSTSTKFYDRKTWYPDT